MTAAHGKLPSSLLTRSDGAPSPECLATSAFSERTLESWLDEGFAALGAGLWKEASQCFAAATALAPEDFDALHGRGLSLLRQGAFAEAEPWLARACANCAEEPGAWRNLALARSGLGNDVEALSALDRAVALAPHDGHMLSLRAAIALECGQGRLAVSDARAAVALMPDASAHWAQLANALIRTGDVQAGLDAAEQALKLDDKLPACHLAMGDVRLALGQPLLAAEAYAAAKQLCGRASTGGTLQESAFGEAWCRLLAGDWRRGLPLYVAHRPNVQRNHRAPEWDGLSDLQGRRLWLLADEGLGDTLMFSRFIPWTQQQGAIVELRAQRTLLPLLASALPGVMVKDIAEPLPPDADLCICLHTLAYFAGAAPDAVPRPLRLSFDDHWRNLAETALGTARGLKVGIAWSGSPLNRLDRTRSLPLQTLLDGLPPDVCLVQLQRDVRAADASVARERGRPIFAPELLASFEGTAALIEQLDLVVTVDTSLAHLAGTLGKPTWILLSSSVDWRWLLHRADTPWYPTARLFRQDSAGDWQGLLRRVAVALEALRPSDPLPGMDDTRG